MSGTGTKPQISVSVTRGGTRPAGLRRLAACVLAAGMAVTGISSSAQAAGTPPAESAAAGTAFAARCPAGFTLGQKLVARHRAGALLTYLAGGPATGLAAASGVTGARLQAAADVLRAELTGTDDYTHVATRVVTGYQRDAAHPDLGPRVLSFFAGSTPAHQSRLRRQVISLGDAVIATLGPSGGACVNEYLLPGGGTDQPIGAAGTRAFAIDPEPATLTADLSSTNGSDGAAYYDISLKPTTVVKWSSTYATLGTITSGGHACSTTGLAAGATTSQIIYQTGTYGKCQ